MAALLDQVEEAQAPSGVLLGDGDHQPEIGHDELLPGNLGNLRSFSSLCPNPLDLGCSRAEASVELFLQASIPGNASAVKSLELLALLAATSLDGSPDAELGARVLPSDRIEELRETLRRGDRQVDAMDIGSRPGRPTIDLPLQLLILRARRFQALLLLVEGVDRSFDRGESAQAFDQVTNRRRRPQGHRRFGHSCRALRLPSLIRCRRVIGRQDPLGEHEVRRQGSEESPLTDLDSAGDLHLAFPVEERDRAHLPQVHADGIAGVVAVLFQRQLRVADRRERVSASRRAPTDRLLVPVQRQVGMDLAAHIEQSTHGLHPPFSNPRPSSAEPL